MRNTFGKQKGRRMRRLARVALLSALVVVVGLTAGCWAWEDSSPSPSPAASIAPTTARATVIAFYTAHAEGREADAYALRSQISGHVPSLKEYMDVTRWRRDLRLTDVGKAISYSAAGRFYRRLFDVRQVIVEFFQAHDAPARERGDAIEFVTVARETPDGPWRIIEIGCGP